MPTAYDEKPLVILRRISQDPLLELWARRSLLHSAKLCRRPRHALKQRMSEGIASGRSARSLSPQPRRVRSCCRPLIFSLIRHLLLQLFGLCPQSARPELTSIAHSESTLLELWNDTRHRALQPSHTHHCAPSKLPPSFGLPTPAHGMKPFVILRRTSRGIEQTCGRASRRCITERFSAFYQACKSPVAFGSGGLLIPVLE